jgi:membrane protein YqaA with SNARE-associated domain
MHVLLEPNAWLLVAVVTLVGTASNVILYKLGKGGTEAVLQRIPRINPERLYRAQDLVEERGSWMLLLSGIPGLGMVLVTGAGILEVRLSAFLLWVLISLGVRNWLVLIAVVEGYQVVSG